MGHLFEKVLALFHVNGSIVKRFRFSFTLVVIILMLPALFSLMTMMRNGGQYHAVITQIEQVSRMRPLISETVPNTLFNIVAGNSTFAQENVQADILRFNEALDTMMRQHDAEDQKELLVARRTMDTMQEYIDRLQTLVADEAPVALQEEALDEIRSVAGLIDEMLGAYVTLRVDIASVSSAEMQATLRVLLVIEVLLLFFALLILVLAQKSLARSIQRPIAKLETLAANLADGNLQARVQRTDAVELIPLANSLNVMADKLQQLIHEKQQEQDNLKKSEMRTLQAQITPHFLYNTLDAIIWLAQTGRTQEVVQITKSMSRFFRVSLSQGRDWITIAEEISHIEAYLTIQQIRYRDILAYEIDVDPSLEGEHILKLTLQPLVENAIYHGIKHRREGGKVTVTGILEGNNLHFSVRDNGVGMPAERLQWVRQALEDRHISEEETGFGLYNVNKRIQLYYGQPAGLSIQSDESGTCVSFVVPTRECKDVQCISGG